MPWSDLGRERAGIVEDNAKNRKLERDILQFHGYRTIEADTAEEAIRLAQVTHPGRARVTASVAAS